MYIAFNDVILKSGETVQAGVVTGPDADWRARIENLLAHKGADWCWQITELLSKPVSAVGRFYLLYRAGVPFAHIMTVEADGVGLFGHVWTVPEDRGQSAASKLMTLVMEDFKARGGQALHLGTGYDSAAYHIYRKQGFESVEPGSGVMAYFRPSQQEFESDHFAPGETTVASLDWRHWATASPLLAGGWPGLLRCAPFGVAGRKPSEGPLLSPLRRVKQADAEDGAARVAVLQKVANTVVVGIAAWGEDPLWPGTVIVDVYCHPAFWDGADGLLAALELPAGSRQIAYAEADFEPKRAALQAAGFNEVAVLPRHFGGRDVVLLER